MCMCVCVCVLVVSVCLSVRCVCVKERETAHPVVHGNKQSVEAVSLCQVRVKPLVQREEDTLSDLIICDTGRGGRG